MQPVGWREAWIAPRGAGTSTYAFLGGPLWALAHGHRNYFMAFSHTSDMALDQLANLRAEGGEAAVRAFAEAYPGLSSSPVDFS